MLQRIAVCYLIATVIYLITGIRGQIAWTGLVLAAYWILLKYVPVPGVGAGVLTKAGNFSHWVDSLFPNGHMYSATKTWDPEGIVSTLPAIATTMFGILTGHILRLKKSDAEKTSWIFEKVFAPFGAPANASLAFALCYSLLFFLVSWFMYRRNWFVRI